MTSTDATPRNPIVAQTVLRAYPGWTVRKYKDGQYDAINGRSVTIGFDTFPEVVGEIRMMGEVS